jgi:hypothetical protein
MAAGGRRGCGFGFVAGVGVERNMKRILAIFAPLATRTGIMWSLFVPLGWLAAWIVFIEFNALGLGGWTISHRLLDQINQHKWWPWAVMWAVFGFLAVLPGHFTQCPRVNHEPWMVLLFVLMGLSLGVVLACGSWIWPQ